MSRCWPMSTTGVWPVSPKAKSTRSCARRTSCGPIPWHRRHLRHAPQRLLLPEAAFVTSYDCAGWVDRLHSLAVRAQGRSAPSGRDLSFQLGDVCLQVDSDGNDFLDEFETHYRDCII